MSDWIQFVIGPGIMLLLAEVIRRLAKVDHQVRANGGKNNPPTLPDKLAIVMAKQDDHDAKLDLLIQSQADHLAWSTEETAKLWQAILRR